MSQYAEITRNGVDRAAPLDFPERRPAEPVTITAHVTFSGIHFEVCFSGQVDQLPALAKRLVALGAESVSGAQATPAPATNGKSTTYADDGTPLCSNPNCSRHSKPMGASQHSEGYFCSGKDALTGNAKGYCKSKA